MTHRNPSFRGVPLVLLIPFLSLSLLFVGGCEEPVKPRPLLPPHFNRGDTVRVQQGETVGIITSVNSVMDDDRVNKHWNYTVMFKDEDMTYSEDMLEVVERFDWTKGRFLKEVQAEIELPH